MLSFSDIDTETTLIFSDSFTIASGTGNLQQSGMSDSNSGVAPSTGLGLIGLEALAFDGIFDEEAAGSLQFTGVFNQLVFQINNGSDGSGEDRTGFIVTTLFDPEAVPEPSTSALLFGLVVFAMRMGRRRRLR